MSDDDEQHRQKKAALFREMEETDARQRAAGIDPSLNRAEFSRQVAISLNLPRDIHHQLTQLAHSNRTSVRHLVAIGVELVLHHAAEGALPVVPSWPLGPDQD